MEFPVVGGMTLGNRVARRARDLSVSFLNLDDELILGLWRSARRIKGLRLEITEVQGDLAQLAIEEIRRLRSRVFI